MENESIMIYLNGKDKGYFRCECGCNLFHHPEMSTWEEQMQTYKCNVCERIYKSDD